MKSDDITIVPEIKTISPLSSPRDQVINTASEGRASSSTDSSDSSPSDLRKRLEDLPSPNEFTFLADHVAAFGRRICRKREIFLRLHGEVNRIEENDEWEEREQRAGAESFLGASKPKDARARRRARVRLGSSPRHDDKAMVISQADGSTGSSKITSNDDKLNPAESSTGRSTRDNDCLKLPVIATSRRHSRLSSLSEPSSSRFSHHNNGESHDTKGKIASHSYRNFTPRDSATKSVEFPSVVPFSLSAIRPKKFGGYRPPSGIILKNLSSGSESESANEASREFSSFRKTDNAKITTLELSSPESKDVSTVNGLIKKMPIMSARSDITDSILPNLLPSSSRSLGDDSPNRRIPQNTSRSCDTGQITRDGTKTSKELGRINTLNTLKAIFNERASCDRFVAKTSREPRQIEREFEDTRYRKQETSQNTLTFSARSFTSESGLATDSRNEQISHDERGIKAYDEFKQIGAGHESTKKCDKKEEDYQAIKSKIYHGHQGIKDQFEFNSPTARSNLEVNPLERNMYFLDTAEWNPSTSFYTEEAVDVPHFVERIQSDVAEEVLSPRTSEPYENEDQLSCPAKIYFQRETSSRKSQNNIDTSDKCDREIITKVPTLVLNSQDMSYSTSAGSRECSVTRPLDPHALIKALSDVSLKQEKYGEDASRKCKDFYRNKNTIDVSSGASDFPTKGETWRVSKLSTPESSRKSLSRVPSRIPVRITSKITSSANKLSEYFDHPQNSSEIANPAESAFIEQNGVQGKTSGENVVYQRPDVNSQSCKRDSSLRSRNENVEVSKVRAGAFAPDDEIVEHEINAPRSLISPNLRSPQNMASPFGDYTYDKVHHAPESNANGESCPPVFFHKAAYSSGRDYAKIDDDGRSRSDRSTSRKSMDTIDITSATESPGLSKYKKNESSRIESRNIEEVTWRTEDECASINDEEIPENKERFLEEKDYALRDKKQDLQANECYEPAMGGTCDSSPFQHLQLNLSSGIEKGGRKRPAGSDDLEFDDKSNFDQSLRATKVAQLEDLTFQMLHRTQELSNFTKKVSSSTLNLNCEPKKKKKRSQERFPFTLSDASEVSSAKHEENTSDYQPFDENPDRARINDQLQRRTIYPLKTHPSITRLATAGMEDTVSDILCCVAQEKKDATSSKSKIKAFVRTFFSKLKKAPKQINDDKTAEPTTIIYENCVCQANSRTDSCSGDSSEKACKMYSNAHWMDHHNTKSKLTLVSSWETLKKTESLQEIAQKHSQRRYDRDDLWVRDIKDFPSDAEKDNKILQRKDEIESPPKESPSKVDRYSIFLAKNFQSDKPSDHDNSLKEQHDELISGHEVPDEKNLISEIGGIEEDLTDCLCWRLCHVITPFKYRSSIKKQPRK